MGIFQFPYRSVRRPSIGILCGDTLYWPATGLRTTLGCVAIITMGRSIRSSMPIIPGNPRPPSSAPEFPMVRGPFNKTDLFFGAGMGFQQERFPRRHHHGKPD